MNDKVTECNASEGVDAELDRLRDALWAIRALRGRIALSNVDRVDKAHRIAVEALTPHKKCACGHLKEDHIYEEGACRPGFECAQKCELYREGN